MNYIYIKMKGIRRTRMIYQLGSTLTDAIVLAIISRGDAYGYSISQQVKKVADIKESTLYPVLRRLQQKGYLETYDQPYQGRNRKYYVITEAGKQQYQFYMEEWKKYKLGEIAVIKGGKRLPKGIELISIPNSHPYIRIRDMYVNKIMELNGDFEYVDDVTQKSIQRYIVKQNDIILAIVGNTLGLVSMVGKSLDSANLTENCVKIVSDNLTTQNYIYYYLNSDFGQNEIKKGLVGAAQPKLPIKNIMDISIALPPLKYQKAVIDVLSSIDDKIELNCRINDNLIPTYYA